MPRIFDVYKNGHEIGERLETRLMMLKVIRPGNYFDVSLNYGQKLNVHEGHPGGLRGPEGGLVL